MGLAGESARLAGGKDSAEQAGWRLVGVRETGDFGPNAQDGNATLT